MAKTKPQTNGKPAKAAPSVKDAGVKKSLQKPAAKAKDVAKTAAAKAAPKEEKKSKKSKKAPEPEPESESDVSDSPASNDDSDDSDDSASDTEPAAVAAPKANGVKKAAAAESSDSDSDESEDEAPAPVKAAPSKAKKANGTVAKPAAKEDSEDSEDDDEEDSDEEPAVPQAKAGANADTSDESDSSDEEDEAPAKKTTKVNGAAKDEEDDDSEDSDDSDESEEEAAPSKKRKADTVSTPAAKKTKTEPATPTEGNGVKNLFVGGLSWNIDEEWLAREFEEYGEVTGSRIITDRETQRSKGYGYVEFADAASAASALKARHESMLDGRQIRVDFSTPRPKAEDATPRDRAGSRAGKFGDTPGNPTETLFCGNLSFDCTSEAVSEAFEEFGSITSVRLPTDRETGAPKGFGYISFGTVEEAKAALEAMNGQSIAGRNCRLDYAQPRDPSSGGGRGGFGDRGGRGGGRGRGGFGDRGGRGGGRGRGGFGDRGGRGGRGGFTTNRGGFGDFKGNKVSFD